MMIMHVLVVIIVLSIVVIVMVAVVGDTMEVAWICKDIKRVQFSIFGHRTIVLTKT